MDMWRKIQTNGIRDNDEDFVHIKEDDKEKNNFVIAYNHE